MSNLQAFLNNPEVKKIYLNRVKAHQKADEIIKGTYWKSGKGCAVGCTIHGNNHKNYENEIGIPEWLAYVEDSLFEGMSIEKSKSWPFEFLNAIKVGVDLNKVKAPFQIIVLENVLQIFDGNKFNEKNFPDIIIKSIEDSKKAVKKALDLWRNGNISYESAARSAESVARSAESAARSAESAARSAESVARSAESVEFDKLADGLLEIIRSIK